LLGIKKQDVETRYNNNKNQKEIKIHEVERIKKLKQTKLRLAETKTSFQALINKLNNKLVIIKI
jgi:hypothetical protein